ncbi:MAG: response regulator [Candidatus Omnitrophota bacterium]|nr:response regulator [Candidatus Omnitrophota bacterium]
MKLGEFFSAVPDNRFNHRELNGGEMLPKTVMIIDDDREFSEELEEALRLSDYETITVKDPALALREAISKKPDVALLDLKMYGQNGFLLANEFKNSRRFADMPIIAMSGCFKNKDSEFLNTYGFKGYLEKPFNPADVIAKIKDVLKSVF